MEGIAAKALKETNLVFISMEHPLKKELKWDSLSYMINNTVPGVDKINVKTAKQDFNMQVDDLR